MKAANTRTQDMLLKIVGVSSDAIIPVKSNYCQLSVPSQGDVSAMQCSIQRDEEGGFVQAASGGVTINGEPALSQRLQLGDRIEMGMKTYEVAQVGFVRTESNEMPPQETQTVTDMQHPIEREQEAESTMGTDSQTNNELDNMKSEGSEIGQQPGNFESVNDRVDNLSGQMSNLLNGLGGPALGAASSQAVENTPVVNSPEASPVANSDQQCKIERALEAIKAQNTGTAECGPCQTSDCCEETLLQNDDLCLDVTTQPAGVTEAEETVETTSQVSGVESQDDAAFVDAESQKLLARLQALTGGSGVSPPVVDEAGSAVNAGFESSQQVQQPVSQGEETSVQDPATMAPTSPVESVREPHAEVAGSPNAADGVVSSEALTSDPNEKFDNLLSSLDSIAAAPEAIQASEGLNAVESVEPQDSHLDQTNEVASVPELSETEPNAEVASDESNQLESLFASLREKDRMAEQEEEQAEAAAQAQAAAAQAEAEAAAQAEALQQAQRQQLAEAQQAEAVSQAGTVGAEQQPELQGQPETLEPVNATQEPMTAKEQQSHELQASLDSLFGTSNDDAAASEPVAVEPGALGVSETPEQPLETTPQPLETTPQPMETTPRPMETTPETTPETLGTPEPQGELQPAVVAESTDQQTGEMSLAQQLLSELEAEPVVEVPAVQEQPQAPEVPAESKQASESGSSVADLLARMNMLPEQVEAPVESAQPMVSGIVETKDETPVAAATPTPAAPAAPAAPPEAPAAPPEAPAAAGGTGDVQDYMNSLLQRLNGEEAPAEPVAAQQPEKSTQSAEALNEQTEQQPVEPVYEKPLSAEEFVPSRTAPELNSNLAAMRELANASSRNAVNRSNAKKSKDKSNNMLLIAGGSIVCAAVLSILSKQPGDLAYFCAIFMFLVTVVSSAIFAAAYIFKRDLLQDVSGMFSKTGDGNNGLLQKFLKKKEKPAN